MTKEGAYVDDSGKGGGGRRWEALERILVAHTVLYLSGQATKTQQYSNSHYLFN